MLSKAKRIWHMEKGNMQPVLNCLFYKTMERGEVSPQIYIKKRLVWLFMQKQVKLQRKVMSPSTCKLFMCRLSHEQAMWKHARFSSLVVLLCPFPGQGGIMIDKEIQLSLSIKEMFHLVKFPGRCRSFILPFIVVCSSTAMGRKRPTGKDRTLGTTFPKLSFSPNIQIISRLSRRQDVSQFLTKANKLIVKSARTTDKSTTQTAQQHDSPTDAI